MSYGVNLNDLARRAATHDLPVEQPKRQWSVISFILCAMLFALCSSAEPQQPKKVRRIGYLGVRPNGESTRSETVQLALRELGHIEGQNIAIEYRYVEGRQDRAPACGQRSRSQKNCPRRGCLRSGHSGQCGRGERSSPSRGACARVDYSAMGGTSCGRYREGIRCAEYGAPRWTLRARWGPATAC